MANKTSEQNKYFYPALLSIVAIVAIVGLILLFAQKTVDAISPAPTPAEISEETALAGEATGRGNIDNKVQVQATYCYDSDNPKNDPFESVTGKASYFTKSMVTSNIYPEGKEDKCVVVKGGKTYLFEGSCRRQQSILVQKNCAELEKGSICVDGACQIPNLVKNYANMFVKDGVFDGYFVVGEKAPTTDNLAMTDIIASMKYDFNGKLTPVAFVGVIKLDVEIEDITAQNLIVIGTACTNTIVSAIEGNPLDCKLGYKPGQSMIKLIKQSSGFNTLLVTGYSSTEIRVAAKVLANRYTELTGTKIEITSGYEPNAWETASLKIVN